MIIAIVVVIILAVMTCISTKRYIDVNEYEEYDDVEYVGCEAEDVRAGMGKNKN